MEIHLKGVKEGWRLNAGRMSACNCMNGMKLKRNDSRSCGEIRIDSDYGYE